MDGSKGVPVGSLSGELPRFSKTQAEASRPMGAERSGMRFFGLNLFRINADHFPTDRRRNAGEQLESDLNCRKDDWNGQDLDGRPRRARSSKS